MASRTARLAALLGALGATLLTSGVAAGPAQAHGAPTSPLSRTYECGSDSGLAGGAACRAALAATGRGSMPDWDEVKVPNVDGQDRTRIPDGQICSAGLDQFRGLDLPRTDWPTTTLTPGAPYRFAFRTTIPHSGTFRVYVTRDGWNPGRALTWAEVEAKPFATATDPPVSNDAYHFTGTLPRKTGRHIILIIWQTTSTPDTYYACSDVRFAGAATTRAPATPPAQASPPAKPAAPPARPAVPVTHPTPASQPPTSAPAGVAVGTDRASFDSHQGSRVPLIAGIAAAAVAVGATAAYGVRRRRAGRHSA